MATTARTHARQGGSASPRRAGNTARSGGKAAKPTAKSGAKAAPRRKTAPARAANTRAAKTGAHARKRRARRSGLVGGLARFIGRGRAAVKRAATTTRPARRRAAKWARRTAHPLARRMGRAITGRMLPAWVMLGSAFFIAMPGAWNSLRNAAYELSLGTPITVALGASQLAPLFTPEVEHWAGDIERWAALYGVDPNLLATVMQIESCGHADISSVAGAQGLFQVMPFHFTPEEVQTDPETNARRGASFLAECMAWGDGNPGRALACYNGGPGVLGRDFSRWPAETQRYYVWGGSIYLDARERQTHSDALDNWLNAGGASLCRLAAEHITDGEVG